MSLELTEEVVCNLRLAVDSFDWSVLTRSCLVGEIEYVWQLIKYNEWELLRFKILAVSR